MKRYLFQAFILVVFLISLAGPGVKGEEILHRQNRDISRLMGMDEKKTGENIATNWRKIIIHLA